MNIAEAAAAETDQTSPTLGGAPSNETSAVPNSAVAADAHVRAGIERPKRTAEKMGTSLTLR